jgi:hypothetical protein
MIAWAFIGLLNILALAYFAKRREWFLFALNVVLLGAAIVQAYAHLVSP